MSDEYACVSKSKLKLKNDGGIKKKKKKSKDKDKEREALQQTLQQQSSGSSKTKPERQLTKAELAFKQQQEKMVSLFYPFTNQNNMSIKLIIVQLKAQQTYHGKGFYNPQGKSRKV